MPKHLSTRVTTDFSGANLRLWQLWFFKILFELWQDIFEQKTCQLIPPSLLPNAFDHQYSYTAGFETFRSSKNQIYILGGFNFSIFLNGPDPPASFCLFSFFSSTEITENLSGFGRIRTGIVRIEGEHAYHLTTTTADLNFHFCKNQT